VVCRVAVTTTGPKTSHPGYMADSGREGHRFVEPASCGVSPTSLSTSTSRADDEGRRRRPVVLPNEVTLATVRPMSTDDRGKGIRTSPPLRTNVMGTATQRLAPAENAPVEPEVRAAILVPAFRDNRHAMYAVARRTCGDDCAADVVQEVFLRVWRSFSFDPLRGSIRTYLLMTTRGVAIDMVRTNVAARRREQIGAECSVVTHDDDDGLAMRWAEERDRIGAALKLLHSREREVIVAAFFDGRTHREIAQLLSIPEGTVKSRIRNAMTKLRYHLRDDPGLLVQGVS
jgi:RNA polymerase sigma-70 factor (ECF subfamily)